MLALAVYVAIIGGLTFGAMRWRATAIACVICANGIFQWTQVDIPLLRGYERLTQHILGGVIVLALAASVIQQRPLFDKYPKTGWIVLAFFFWTVMTILWSIDGPRTANALRAQAPRLMAHVIMAPLVILSLRDARQGLMTAMGVGGLMCAALLFSPQWEGRALEVEGVEGLNPLGIANLGGAIAMVALLLSFRGTMRWLQWGRWVIVAIAMILVTRTQSRGQFLAALGVGVLFIPMSRKIKNTTGFFSLIISAALLGVLAFAMLQMVAAGKRWHLEEMIAAFSETRGEAAWAAITYWFKGGPFMWMFGIGNTMCFHDDVVGFYPHIVVVEVMVEEGLIGLGLLLWLVVETHKAIMRTFRRVHHDEAQRGTIAALAALFWMVFLLSFKQGSMLSTTGLFMYAIVIGRVDMITAEQHARSAAPRPALSEPDYAAPTVPAQPPPFRIA